MVPRWRGQVSAWIKGVQEFKEFKGLHVQESRSPEGADETYRTGFPL
jgi:hypothetical protein